MIDDALGLAVVEADVVEGNRPLVRLQRLGIRFIDDIVCLCHHADAVIDRTDVLEERRDFPHDPLRHAVDAHRQTDRNRDRADRDGTRQPEMDAKRGDGKECDAVVGINEDVEQRHLAHLAMYGVEETVHAVTRIAFLAAGMGEQLDRADIGVAVDDPARHHRARVGLLLGDLLQARHEIADDADVDREPDGERDNEAPVGCRHDREHGDEVADDIDEDVEDLHHRFAHRKRRLHHLRRHASSELVGKEGHALTQQVAVHLPAGDHRIVAEQHLVHDQRVDRHQARQADEDERAHPE
ncbi:hypothetical protein D9M72_406130 [compost metagenome]